MSMNACSPSPTPMASRLSMVTPNEVRDQVENGGSEGENGRDGERAPAWPICSVRGRMLPNRQWQMPAGICHSADRMAWQIWADMFSAYGINLIYLRVDVEAGAWIAQLWTFRTIPGGFYGRTIRRQVIKSRTKAPSRHLGELHSLGGRGQQVRAVLLAMQPLRTWLEGW